MPHELEEERERQLLKEEELESGKEKDAQLDAAVTTARTGVAQRPRMVTAATQTAGSEVEDPNAILLAAPGLQPHRDPHSTGFPLLEPIPSDFGARLTPSRSPNRLQGDAPEAEYAASHTSYHPSAAVRVLKSIWFLLRPIATSPPTMVLIAALIISLIPTLRALFIAPAAGATFHPTAPDGKPPLAVLYDTATFVGGASVPTGLIVLGASIAKIRVPRPISRLPLSGIIGMALVRIAIMPIIGFFFVKQLVRIGLIEESNKVLRFGTPSLALFGSRSPSC